MTEAKQNAWDHVENYKKAVATANHATLEHTKVEWPYSPGTPEHRYWLERFDEAFAKLILGR